MADEYHLEESPEARKFTRAMSRAFDRREAVAYFRACNELGLGEPGIADLELYEQGRIIVSRNHDYWGKISGIALPLFSELQEGESVSAGEIKLRLGKLREAGYKVEPYSKMDKQQLWNYFARIRSEVYRNAEEHCPDILERIRGVNSRQKESGLGKLVR